MHVEDIDVVEVMVILVVAKDIALIVVKIIT
jgi:hypothetical protein